MQYTRELARIKATQYRQRIARYGRPAVRIPEPVTFERWFLLGIRRYEKKGAEFEFLAPGLVKIIWPGKPAVLRTVADFEREYQNDYLSRF
ncbi:hypothetical protein MSKOL_2025 [Methanosarcina sp. Kolksee]|uniref:hypothetical protein n=1 Tax=Methanosarcina sp. Kolksee TaxID=1434099 RepID=UPI000615B71F|nr:hypothetical protein [Methanosarcina sp. Kolksee]AKB47802.1 hypothetical protein MSKOL_2025 [Methanosarcina sp. Kolksee]